MTSTANGAWSPLITGVDLPTISKQSFDEKIAEFDRLRSSIPEEELPPQPFTEDGWYDITPEMAEAFLLNSGGNRQIALAAVRAFAHDMGNGGWLPTGEPICISAKKTQEGHHRGFAGYLSGVTFRSYVVVTVPQARNLFAYYNCGKARTPSDALHIAGFNGSGRIMSAAIADLALRYDAGALGVGKQKRFPKATARDTLAYVEAHPDFSDAARHMLANHADSVETIVSKSAAVYFAWLVIRAYDKQTLDSFCISLGTGAKLDEDSPVLAARNRLLRPESAGQPKLPPRTRLAYLCKAFLMHVNGQKMGRSRGKVANLSIDLDDPFPRIDPPLAAAAE
jgi:hypothetical protein